MNRSECTNEKISGRTVGLILLPLGFLLGGIGFVLLPVFGLFFAFNLYNHPAKPEEA